MVKAKCAVVCVLLCVLGCLCACTNTEEQAADPFPISVSSGELLCRSEEGFHSVEVYRQKQGLVINAKSEAAFFDGAQFLVNTEQPLSAEAVKVVWMTVGGGTKKTADNDLIIAEITVRENDTVLFDKKVNFMKKGIEAVVDVLDKNGG